jgi:hypothetical protein
MTCHPQTYPVERSDTGCIEGSQVSVVRQVRQKGYVCLWSTVLEDNIAFVDDILEEDLRPKGFVIYTLNELSKLFGDLSLSADSLRMIHNAKKYGGKITNVRPASDLVTLASYITR